MQNKRLFNLFLSLTLVAVLFVAPLSSMSKAQVAQQTQSVVAPEYAEKLAAIEKKVEERRQALGIPGMSLAIVKDDKIIYMKGLGYKDFEKKIAVTPDTLFAIGSVTKSFTGMTIVMSQDDGKLSLEDSPKKYLSYFKMRDPETDAKITVRDLLRHSSGLNRTDLAMVTGKLNRMELIQVAGEAKPTAKLGEKFQYQNIMYSAAGEVVASAQKTTWENFVETRIFKPLGMTNSYTAINAMEKAKDASFGYDYNVDTKETRRLPYRDIPFSAPAGSITSSAKDMAQWIRFVLNGGIVDGKRLVSEKGFNETVSPQMKVREQISYGFGWLLRDWNGHKVVEHGGNIDGFNAQVAMMPAQKLGFVMLTNVTASPLGGELTELVWATLVGKPESKTTTSTGTNGNNATPNAKIETKDIVGAYKYEEAGFNVDVMEKSGKFFVSAPGLGEFALENVEGYRYKIQPPAPDGLFVIFQRSKTGEVEALFEQPGNKAILPKVKTESTTSTTTPTKTPKNADAYKELVGNYQFEKSTQLKAEVAIKENTLRVMLNDGQNYAIEEVEKDVFKLIPLPDSFRLKVKRDDRGGVSGLIFVQPGAESVFNRVADSAKPTIAVDELMSKVVAAMGHANYSKYKTVVSTFDMDFENQGVTGSGTSYAKAPNKAAMSGTLVALKKEIGTIHEYFDGTNGATELSFMPIEKYTGKRLANAAINADFNGLANWKTLFKTVEIKRMDKVGDEEVYVVEMTPENGTVQTIYFSTKSFLMLRRDSFEVSSDSSQLQLPVTETFSDYRSVGGVMISFRTVQNTLSQGDIVVKVKDVKFDVDIPDTMFQSKAKK
jgi:CubicO group peptidase (beta-lactamase class C family)